MPARSIEDVCSTVRDGRWKRCDEWETKMGGVVLMERKRGQGTEQGKAIYGQRTNDKPNEEGEKGTTGLRESVSRELAREGTYEEGGGKGWTRGGTTEGGEEREGEEGREREGEGRGGKDERWERDGER
jgi:hypothetical protein